MKRILIAGAGQSTPVLIRYLLEQAQAHDWYITVGDMDLNLARSRVAGNDHATAVRLDVTDAGTRNALIAASDVVVNMLPPTFQYMVANDCVRNHTHMVSASYADFRLNEIDADANRGGVLILNECGLDPGIDHMSAMELIERVKMDGARIRAFSSYGAGLPAPEFDRNPFRYAVTWSPRNIVMSGEKGATYLLDGKVRMVPWHEVFRRNWQVQVDGVGPMEAYPNRDSLYYQRHFGLEDARTMIRGTLRYPGWCDAWQAIVRLGLPNETMHFPRSGAIRLCDLTEMFLPAHSTAGNLRQRIAAYLAIDENGEVMSRLEWLGLFSDAPVPAGTHTAAQALTRLLVERLDLGADDRDMVVLMHELEVETEGRVERITSTMIEYGTPETTAMSRSVGLPAGIATSLILRGELPMTGCQLPTHPTIRRNILAELRDRGFAFSENRRPA